MALRSLEERWEHGFISRREGLAPYLLLLDWRCQTEDGGHPEGLTKAVPWKLDGQHAESHAGNPDTHVHGMSGVGVGGEWGREKAGE